MGSSLTQIAELLAIVVPTGKCPSRAKLRRWVHVRWERAGKMAQLLELADRPLVVALCIDDIFFHRQPVLVGVEPHSMAWLICQKEQDRSGRTWYQVLQPWKRLEYAVADAGSGLLRHPAAEVIAV